MSATLFVRHTVAEYDTWLRVERGLAGEDEIALGQRTVDRDHVAAELLEQRGDIAQALREYSETIAIDSTLRTSNP